jgi:hypothetical protein
LGHIDAAEAFGHRDHARTKRCPGHRLKRPAFAPDPHEFGRAAADVEHQRARRSGIDQRFRTSGREPGFGLPGYDLKL